MRFFVLSWLFVAVLIGYSCILQTTRLPMPALGAAIAVTLIAAVAVSRDYRERALRAGVRPLVAVHLARFAGINNAQRRKTYRDCCIRQSRLPEKPRG